MSESPLSNAEQIRRLYEEAEARTASAMENLVSSEAFAELLGMMTSNVIAVTKLATDGLDQVVRNLRLAGRLDIARLGRQLGRTEDKLELVLQAVRSLEARMDAADRARAADPGPATGAGSTPAPASAPASVNGSAAAPPAARPAPRPRKRAAT